MKERYCRRCGVRLKPEDGELCWVCKEYRYRVEARERRRQGYRVWEERAPFPSGPWPPDLVEAIARQVRRDKTDEVS